MLTRDQFVERLSDSGIVAPDLIQELADRTSGGDTASFAEALVERNLLTPFQVERFLAGEHEGLVFGEYVLIDRIGAGGMGVVFKARHRRMKRTVALKLMPEALETSPTAVRRFYREVEAAAKLIHPNIVTAYDASEANGKHYLVMEYVEGEDLSACLQRRGPLPIAEAIECVLQAARGLDYAHRNGVIHRDVKPANMLRSPDGVTKLLDMGLARLEQEDETAREQTLTLEGRILGTAEYLAPEQAVSAKAADHRADIYSLGCTLYRLLAGRSPYSGETAMAIIIAQREQPIPRLRDVRADVPDALDALYQRMVAKRPEDRPQSMGEVIEALEQVAAGAAPASTNADVVLAAAAPTIADPPTLATSSDAATIMMEDDASAASIAAGSEPTPLRLRGAVKYAIIVVAALLLVANFLRSNSAVVVIEMGEADRGSVKLTIDGKPRELDATGPLRLFVAPGERRIVLDRDGYEPIEWTRSLKRGEEVVIEPEWRRVASLGEPVDLIAALRANPSDHKGQWRFEGDRMRFRADTMTGAQFNTPLPDAYVLEMEIEPYQDNGLIVILSSHGHPFALNIQREMERRGRAGYLSGIGKIDDRPVTANEATRVTSEPFAPPGTVAKVRIDVRRDGIEAAISGFTVIDWKGDPSRLSLEVDKMPRHEDYDPRRMYVATFGDVAIGSVTLRPYVDKRIE